MYAVCALGCLAAKLHAWAPNYVVTSFAPVGPVAHGAWGVLFFLRWSETVAVGQAIKALSRTKSAGGRNNCRAKESKQLYIVVQEESEISIRRIAGIGA